MSIKTPILNAPAKRTPRSAKAKTTPTPLASPAAEAISAAPPPPPGAIYLPALQPGERYGGIALDDQGTPTHHLVLMALRPATRLNWQAAMDWAASVGGTLPTRQEQALLFANCKAHLERTWHWSGEEYEGDASYAWYCNFRNGDQNNLRKSYEGSAVAVRRLVVQSFNPLLSCSNDISVSKFSKLER